MFLLDFLRGITSGCISGLEILDALGISECKEGKGEELIPGVECLEGGVA